MEAKQQVTQAHRRHLGTQKRDARNEHTFDTRQEPPGESYTASSPVVTDLIRREMESVVNREMAKLESQDIEVLTMRCFDGLSTRETAMQLGVSKSTASKRFVNATTKLKMKLVALENDG